MVYLCQVLSRLSELLPLFLACPSPALRVMLWACTKSVQRCMDAQGVSRNIHGHFMYMVYEYQILEPSNTNAQRNISFILNAVIMRGISYTVSSTYKHCCIYT